VVNGDGCSSTCFKEDGFECVGASDSVCDEICGDARKVGLEACDDGNLNGLTACKADCSGPVSGWSCTGGDVMTPSTCIEVCGDGIITGAESCD